MTGKMYIFHQKRQFGDREISLRKFMILGLSHEKNLMTLYFAYEISHLT